ncbi:hypothetical protein EDB80DRAFT_689796 [Ilyonectria destructans]|nr:hypothetical protein EDB80DRAFT_689796 [Ilyonectria destructans]
MSRLVLRRLPMMIGPMLPFLGAPGNRQNSRRQKSQKTDIGGKKNATVMGAVDYDDSPDGGERQQAERRAEAGRAARRSAQGHATHGTTGTQWVTARTGDRGWTGWGAGGCQQSTQRLLAGWLAVCPVVSCPQPTSAPSPWISTTTGGHWAMTGCSDTANHFIWCVRLPSDPCLSYIAQRHHAAIPAGLVDAPRRFSTPLDALDALNAPLDPQGVGVDALDVLGRPKEGEP